MRRSGKDGNLEGAQRLVRLVGFTDGGKEVLGRVFRRRDSSPEGPTMPDPPEPTQLLPKPLTTSSRWSPEDGKGEDRLRHFLEG